MKELMFFAISMCAGTTDFRPPAVPLVTIDPYTSVWSFSDRLYDSWPCHWTGVPQGMAGIIRVDGKPYRFIGPESVCLESVRQEWVAVRPTETLYEFAAGPVRLNVSFLTPMLPNNLELISRPVTYITFEITSADGQDHEVSLYLDATGEWAVNKADQQVVWKNVSQPGGPKILRIGSQEQPILEKKGDGVRIDWGYLYFYIPAEIDADAAIVKAEDARALFRDKGGLPGRAFNRQPRAANDAWPALACTLRMGKVGAAPAAARLLVAYDDIYSIEFMKRKLRPWWWTTHGDFLRMMQAADKEYAELAARSRQFDAGLLDAAARTGGPEYAQLIGLSYRHVFASGKIVAGPDGRPWFFHKECFSNGCIATVDVSYPASPFFALFAPECLKGMLKPVFAFAASENWKWPFAPHDVGTYPKANGQVYNAGKLEGQMPVEECGNMLLMTALLAEAEQNAAFAQANWQLLTQWADYLREKGLDPENQLCTDDFAGHLAHNTNLSLKAIIALGAFAKLGERSGSPTAGTYMQAAKQMAAKWPQMADDGDHYRLAFDKPGTWSLKYNLVLDKLLGLGLFPAEIAQKEVAHYLKVQNQYGVPLDVRKDYTKSDWLVWSATMAPSQADFEALIKPLYLFCHETPDRCPFTDWYDTKTAKCVGFRARPVIGGIFIKFLADDHFRRAFHAARR